MSLHVNPCLIVEPLDDDFLVVVNPFVKHGLKILNRAQYEILNMVESKTPQPEIAAKAGITEEELSSVIESFAARDMINGTGEFTRIHEPGEPRKMSLWVQTTNSCNLRCSYCYIATKDIALSMDEPVMKELGDRIVETAARRRLTRVSLRLSGGEPFIVLSKWKPFIRDMKSRFRELGCSFTVVFLTNGTLINDDIISFLNEEQIPLSISLDGLKKGHDLTRKFRDGQGSFDVIMKNLKKLKKRGIRFSIMTVISNDNVSYLPAMTKFFIRENIRFRYSLIDGTNLDYERLSREFNRCLRIFEKHVDRGYRFSRMFKLCDLKFGSIAMQTCSSGHSGGAVYVDGSVYFCQKQFGTATPLGSLSEEEDILSLARRGAHYNDLPEECLRCAYRYICSGGCPLEHVGRLNPECVFYKEFIPKMFRLIGKEKLLLLKKKALLGKLD